MNHSIRLARPGFLSLFLLGNLLCVPLRAEDFVPERIQALFPSVDAMTDQDVYRIDLRVAEQAGFSGVELLRKAGGREETFRFAVRGARGGRSLPLQMGQNNFSVSWVDARGRKVKGSQFRVFRLSGNASADPFASSLAPETGPLTYLQPDSSSQEKECPLPSAHQRKEAVNQVQTQYVFIPVFIRPANETPSPRPKSRRSGAEQTALSPARHPWANIPPQPSSLSISDFPRRVLNFDALVHDHS